MTDLTANASTNYTQDMINTMTNDYSATPTRDTAEALALAFDKPVRSVIAKLSSLGIYVAQARATKAGDAIVRKEALVAQIEAAMGIEVPTLAKATKHDLMKLAASVSIVAVQ